MVRHHEALHTVIREALNGIHVDREKGILLESHGASKPHVVGAVAWPARAEADTVGTLRNLMDKVLSPQAIHAQREVRAMLLDGAHPQDDHRLGLVLDPILECGPGQLPKPEFVQLTVL
jgi:hypothetical protein